MLRAQYPFLTWKVLLSTRYSNNRHFTHSGQWICQRLEARTLIKIEGASVADYLQGLFTNDIRHITESNSKCIFGMFLNTKGRVLYDSLIYKASNDRFLIESDLEIANELVKHLTMFKVRRKLSINIVDDLAVYNIFHLSTMESLKKGYYNEAVVKLPVAIEEDLNAVNVCVHKDPRCGYLGYRLLVPHSLDLTIFAKNDIHEAPSSSTYNRLRYITGIAEGIKELPSGNCFALESNCDYLHGVSFHKGCYLGQEVTARTHHTGVVRKRIMPVIFDTEVSVPINSIVKGESDKTLGKIRGVEGNYGVALLRIEDVLKAKQLEVEGIRCSTYRPSWWPKEAPKAKQA